MCPYACSHGTSLLWLDGFSRNVLFMYFSNICRENSSFIKIWKEWLLLYMETDIHFWSYLAHFFLELQIFQTKVVEKIKTHILFSVTIFEYRAIYEIMRKRFAEPERPQMAIWRIRIACWVPKSTNIQTHTRYVILISFPPQRWLHERASVLRYAYIACLVGSKRPTV